MELDYLNDAAPELASWITNRGSGLFEEQPRLLRTIALELDADEDDQWFDPEL